MPRIRQYEESYAMNDFVAEINAQCGRYGYKTQTSLGRELGVCQSTAGNYLRFPETIPMSKLRQLVKVLRLDPLVVLKALGYSEKELRSRLREGAA